MNAIEKMESQMSADAIKKAHKKAEREILAIRLAQLREEQNVRQSEMENFTQTAVSKIEKRTDMKISTLIDYLESIGMGVKITAYPKCSMPAMDERVLLEV